MAIMLAVPVGQYNAVLMKHSGGRVDGVVVFFLQGEYHAFQELPKTALAYVLLVLFALQVAKKDCFIGGESFHSITKRRS